jgi:hypothetical protein
MSKLDDSNLEGKAQQLENVLRTSTTADQAKEKVHEMLLFDAGHMNSDDFNKVKERWREMNQEDLKNSGKFDKASGYKLPEVEVGAFWDSNRITLDENRGGLRLQQGGQDVLTSKEYDKEHDFAAGHRNEEHSYARLDGNDPGADVPTYAQNADGSQDLGLTIPPLSTGSVLQQLRPHVQPGKANEANAEQQQFFNVSFPDGSRWDSMRINANTSPQELQRLNEQAAANTGHTLIQDKQGNWYYPVRQHE